MLTALLKVAVELMARQLKRLWLCETSWIPAHLGGGDGGAAIERAFTSILFHPPLETDLVLIFLSQRRLLEAFAIAPALQDIQRTIYNVLGTMFRCSSVRK